MRYRILSEVLYRKWRPSTLSDLVGQEHISKTLRNAVKLDRIAHAYLFCGPRGTGKTSTARILAKSINCESTDQGNPDNNCVQCEDINLGRSMDLIEIDGASNRRIADIRELSEKIHYSPTSAKNKVYIIDEVHMLTQEAFNALLKTLEEPPSHAVLILATTDVQKVPATIISRCQRFDFKHISVEAISDKLRFVCESESVDISSDALDLIARKSTGSLRDAENFLEQVIVSFGTKISLDNLLEFFNIDDNQFAVKIITEIIESDLKNALNLVSDFYESGKDANHMLLNMIEIMRSLILVKANAISEKDLGESTWKSLNSVSSKLEMHDLINMVKVFSDSQLQNSITPIFPLEVAIVQVFISLKKLPKDKAQSFSKSDMAFSVSESNQSDSYISQKSTHTESIKSSLKSQSITPNQIEKKILSKDLNSIPKIPDNELDEKWNDILKSLRQIGNRFNLAALLRGCHNKYIDGDSIVFKFKHISHMERLKTELDNPVVFGELNKVIQEILAKEYKVEIELLEDALNDNKSPSQNSHLVKTVQALGARIVEERGK